jgi:nuclear GTP-binding protein
MNRNRNLSDLAQDAERRAAQFEDEKESDAECEVSEMTTGVKDSSIRAYYREFKKVVDMADVVLEVLDARDPMGCRAKHIEETVIQAGVNKKIILILNKIG